MNNLNLYRILFILFLLASCEETFEYHPNEIRLEESEQNLTHKYIRQIGSQNAGDTVRLILMGDTQRFYDHTTDFISSAREQQSIDFMLHCGDISDFGMAQEFKWVHSQLKELPYPYLTVIGNHDLLANGRKVYERMYGPKNYFIDYGGIRFIMIDTNSREYSFNGKVPDINWLSSVLKLPEGVDQAVVVSHIPPFDGDFDPALEQDFIQILKNNKKVKLSLHGHKHASSTSQPYGDEVSFVVTNSMKGRSYFIVEIWKEGFDVQEIQY